MVAFVICVGIVLWVAYRVRADGGERLVRAAATATIWVAAVVVLLPILFYLGIFFAAVVGGAATFLGVNPDVVTALSFVAASVPVVIVIIVCAMRLCGHASKARTSARSVHARKQSNVALPPPFDDDMERVIWKIARDRADMWMSQLKGNLRRVPPQLNDPPTERHRVDEEMEKATSKIARDRADILMSQRKSNLRRRFP